MLTTKSRGLWQWLAVAAFWQAVFAASIDADETVLFDFDGKVLSIDWTAVGEIKVVREEIPEYSEEDEQQVAPAGKGVMIHTEGMAGVFAKSGRVPDDWRSFREVSFWVHRDAEEAKRRPKSVMEMQLYEPDGKARFWRRVEVSHTGWKQFTLPLRGFRWGSRGRIPRWDYVDRLGFWFRDAAELAIDSVHASRGNGRDAAYFSLGNLAEIAFGGDGDSAVRTATRNHAALITDADQINTSQLVNHLGRVANAIREDLPFANQDSRRPVLLVFATRDSYQAFSPRLAQQLNSNAARPHTDGFTIHGIATSYWTSEFDSVRPVFTHEFVHATLAQTVRLDTRLDWLHEGLATRYQLQFHAQSNLPQIVKNGIERDELHMPLPDLCNGTRIPLDRYWQAMTVVDFLLDDNGYGEQFGELFTAFQDAGSPDLTPHLQTILKTNWAGLTAGWKKYCHEKYVAESDADD